MENNPIQIAKIFVDKYFPDSTLALLSGSVAKNEQTITSDLDILVICDKPECPYKESFYDFNWPIEAFVHSEKTVIDWMINNKKRRSCSMAKIINDGIILKNTESIYDYIKNMAIKILNDGPEVLTYKEDIDKRYIITDYLDDFIGCDNYYEQIFIINELVPEILNYKLSKENKWQSRGKYLSRFSKDLSNDFYNIFMNKLESFYKSGEKVDLIEFISNELKNNGGRFFAGHKT